MSRNIVETVLGAVVIIVALGFLGWAYSQSNVGDPGGYTLRAKFDRIDGLENGSAVRISGIRVGQVISQELDPVSYQAEVRFSVKEGIELPSDSSAAVVSTSLLGGKYIALQPGSDDIMLEEGDEITFTQSALNLEDMIGSFIYGEGGS